MIEKPDEVPEIPMFDAISNFIAERLQAKLDNLKPEEDEKRQNLIEKHQRDVWLDDAAERLCQLTLVTHTIKNIHPKAVGTEIRLKVPFIDDHALIGTHTVRVAEREPDVSGNAALLGLWGLLKLQANGTRLLDAVLAANTEAQESLSSDPETGRRRCEALAGIAKPVDSPSSHTLAKQVYFPVDDEESYHLLAPLYGSALAHAVFRYLQAARFSDSVKAAREAKKKRQAHGTGYCDHLHLLRQSFGGTKPQNISQLNSERGGKALLFCASPPTWRSTEFRPALRQPSVFDQRRGHFAKAERVRELTRELRDFLQQLRGPKSNLAMRDRRAELVDDLAVELLIYGDGLRRLQPRWSLAGDCDLPEAERLWLDPRAEQPEAEVFEGISNEVEAIDWAGLIAQRFAHWLNAVISTKDNPMQAEEAHAWQRIIHPQLRRLEQELQDEA